jgi:hypothetical protein
MQLEGRDKPARRYPLGMAEQLDRQADEELLREYLARGDAPCPGCGYNLRGLTTDVCPECAQRLLLSVSLAEPRVGLLLAGTVGLAAGAGFSILVGLWGLMEGARAKHLLPLVVAIAVEGVALRWWVKHRTWVRTRDPAARIVLVGACWTLTAAMAAWFMAVVR